MNYIVVEQENRLQVLVSIVERKKDCIVVVGSQIQVEFYQELFAILKIKAEFTTNQGPHKKLAIYYDNPSGTQGLMFVYSELPEGAIEQQAGKLRQFLNEEIKKLMSRNYSLYTLAERAYKDYISTYPQKELLNPHKLCHSFGFEVTPKLNNFRLKASNEYTKIIRKPISKSIRK